MYRLPRHTLGLFLTIGIKPILWLTLGFLVLLFILFVFIKLFYEKCAADEALVRSGPGGMRVALQGGMWVFGIVHKFQRVTLRTFKLNVTTGRLRSETEAVTDVGRGQDAVGGKKTKDIDRDMDPLRTSDCLPIVLDGEFHVRVPRTQEYILTAAATMGEQIDPTRYKSQKRVGGDNDADLGHVDDQAAQAILLIIEQKLRSAIRDVTATMTLSEMHTNRFEFAENVSEQLRQELKEDGLELEAFEIGSLDQEPLEVVSRFAYQNDLDAIAFQTITKALRAAQKGRNEARRKNLEVRKNHTRMYIAVAKQLGSLPGELDEFVAAFTADIQKNPDYAHLYNIRGYHYDQLGQYDKAIADYTEAIRIEPNDAEAYHNRGVVYGGLGQYDKAIADYTQTIRIDPDDAEAFVNRGNAYQELGERAKAAADFARAKELRYELPDEE